MTAEANAGAGDVDPPLPDQVERTEAAAQRAYELERKIKHAASHIHSAWWDLAEHLHTFHEGGYWRPLGYDTLAEFLAQPELGISRTQFFRLTKLWQDLVVVRQIKPESLHEIEPSKVREVAPAIMAGEVEPSKALSDAQALSYRDVRERYRPDRQAKHGQKPDDSTSLAAEDEPVKVECPTCGSWVDADVIDGGAE
jgi:hypothetical protein